MYKPAAAVFPPVATLEDSNIPLKYTDDTLLPFEVSAKSKEGSVVPLRLLIKERLQ
jgi:hypothetical protein